MMTPHMHGHLYLHDFNKLIEGFFIYFLPALLDNLWLALYGFYMHSIMLWSFIALMT